MPVRHYYLMTAGLFVFIYMQHQDLMAQYEKKQKELKNLCVEESQLKRALAMRLDKESKQNIRRHKKREMKEQHVQEVLGYLTISEMIRYMIHYMCRAVELPRFKFNTQIWTALSDSVTRSTTSVKRWLRGSKRSPVRPSSSRPRSRAWEMSVAKRRRERRYEQRICRLTAHVFIWNLTVSLCYVQALYDTLSTSMDELHRRIETHVVDLKRDVTKMSANF